MRPRALTGRAAPGLALAALLVAPSAPASAGGTPPELSGGAAYGSALPTPDRRPVATRLTLSPRSVTAGGKLPRISFRVRERGTTRVRTRIAVLRLPSNKKVAGIAVGWVKAGRTVTVRLPVGTVLRKGRYLVRLHATDRRGRTLRRTAKRPGRTQIVVKGVRQPPAGSPGVFPVAGTFRFGSASARFGAGRAGHAHQGQDITAATGTPVVAPYIGRISVTSYQASGAGEYVVLDAVDGRDYFFAHCLRHSTVVDVGDVVLPRARLCAVGATGSATGPHLHFEIWRVGWRVGGGYPIDPLPELRAWANR